VAGANAVICPLSRRPRRSLLSEVSDALIDRNGVLGGLQPLQVHLARICCRCLIGVFEFLTHAVGHAPRKSPARRAESALALMSQGKHNVRHRSLSPRTGVEWGYTMDRAEERTGPEDVGAQALMRGLETAFPFVRLGLSRS
jgi:hypothetical protein